MSQYGENLRVIAKYNPSKFYDFYCEIGKEIEDKNMLGLYRTLKTTSDETLDRISEGHQYVPNKDYNTLFKYSSLEEYMKKKKVNPYLIIKFSSQLEGIPDKKEFMSNLPFDYGHLFSNSDLIVLLNVGLEEAANTFKYQKEAHGQSDSRIFRMVRKSANVGGSNEYYK